MLNYDRGCNILIEEWILCGKIDIEEIPFEYRICYTSFYAMTFRFYRDSKPNKKQYLRILHLLIKDLENIKTSNNGDCREELIESLCRILHTYAHFYPFEEDNEIVEFKKANNITGIGY